MYGLSISIGGILAFLISEKKVKEKSLDLRVFYLVVNVTIVLGVIGARLWHVIDYWFFYKENIGQIIAIWHGGLGIFGALLGGFVGTVLVLRHYKEEKIFMWMDVLVLGLPLAQAIGRWGNYFNKELYGVETSLPWGIWINGQKHHPLFLYESILDLTLFFVLQHIWKRKNRKEEGKEGTIFTVYLLSYLFIRVLLQPLRI